MNCFDHQRPVRDKLGQIKERRPSPAARVTRETLDGHFGSDSGRPLTVTLQAGDLIVMRPQGTRRRYAISAFDVYHYAIRCEANRRALEKARAAKDRRAQRLADQRQARAEKRLFRS